MASPVGDATAIGFDAARVSTWMAGLGVGARLPLEFRRVGAGKSNLTVLATDANGRRWILRRPALGPLLPSAHDVAREHRIIRALTGTPVPVPRPFALCEDTAICEAPLMLVEHVDGVVLETEDDALPFDRAARGAIGEEMVATLAKIHAVDLEGVGLNDLGSHAPYAARQLRRWRRQWERSRTRDLPLVEEVAERLDAAIPPQVETTLVHGDFHLRNMIIDPDSAQIRAVLDWELCTLGDPLADVGALLTYWPEVRSAEGGIPSITALPGFASHRELVAAYARASGRDVSAVAFWHALGCWKVAIIAEGILRRGLNDPRNAEPLPAAMVDDLVAQASAILDRA